ncbi:MAG: smr protein/Muts2-like [Hyphococcus sp.]|nr:MAG: smr protein/Muts2-like [Marinicaulis sp.]
MNRKLTPEELALWRRTTRHVDPLTKSGVRDFEHFDNALKPSPNHPAVKPLLGKRHQVALKTTKNTSNSRKAPDRFVAGDPRLDRHARKGRLPIDATFDLHGHNQVTARAALYGFLLEAAARGNRCVLVITGKGVRADSYHAGFNSGRLGAGILRRRFREWLNEDAFRQHVVRAAPAHPRHGGSGAFYVFLKAR